jgi:hypothetical protein
MTSGVDREGSTTKVESPTYPTVKGFVSATHSTYCAFDPRGNLPPHHYHIVAVPHPIRCAAPNGRPDVLGAVGVSLYIYRRGPIARAFGKLIDRWHNWRARVRRRKAGYRP